MDCDISLPVSNYGVLSRPDGSTIFSQGKTTVMAGVYGPVETKLQKILINKAVVEAHFRPKSGLPGVGDRLYESIIKKICETALIAALYPRSTISIIVQEMQNGGELIACAVNAACLALLDSGIDMRFMIAAVTCCLTVDEDLIIHPDTIQQEKSKAMFTFVFDSCDGQIVASYTTGTFKVEHYEHSVSMCKKASVKVFDYYKSVIAKKYKNK